MADASRSRIDPRAGFAGPGVKACRECGLERPKGAGWRTFCSKACIHAWKIRSQPAYAAKLVLERDHGVCASCSLDTIALRAELQRLERQCGPKCNPYRLVAHQHVECAFADRCDEVGLSPKQRTTDRRLWEMDHVTPVVEGGGSCGLDNLRTLCRPCHARATATLRSRMTQQKREASHA